MSNFKSAAKRNPMLQHPDEISGSTWNNANQEVYQELEFTNVQLPEIDNWKTGSEYEIVLKVKMEKKIDKSQNNITGEFKVLQVKSEVVSEDDALKQDQERIKHIME